MGPFGTLGKIEWCPGTTSNWHIVSKRKIVAEAKLSSLENVQRASFEKKKTKKRKFSFQ